MQDPKRMGRLCRLIENFESFNARFNCDYDTDPTLLEIPLDDPDYSDDMTKGDMYWS